jgi:hypothetical protein
VKSYFYVLSDQESQFLELKWFALEEQGERSIEVDLRYRNMENRELADNFYKSGKWRDAIAMYAKCKGDYMTFANRRSVRANIRDLL